MSIQNGGGNCYELSPTPTIGDERKPTMTNVEQLIFSDEGFTLHLIRIFYSEITLKLVQEFIVIALELHFR